MKRLATLLMLPLLALLPTANAQQSSATISGLVTDATGGAIVGATVQLTSDLTTQLNEFKTDSGGRYQFQVSPGAYTLHIAQSGFKAFDQKITVGQAERFANPDIKLTVGDVTTSVEVQGEIAHVQTESSDRTITVNTQQIENTPSAGRNYLNILRSLPGTATTTTTDGRGGTGAAGGGGAPAVNGGAGQLLVTINGIASQDTGAPGTGGYQAPSVDAIGEVQVMVSNYTAEYGARNGGQMNVVIKNGTNQFHGSAYYYHRHEMFNANEFFNNKNVIVVNGIPGQAVAKSIYRWQNPGGTIGGPLYIPGKFNRDKNRLFFFYSDDELRHHGTNGPNRYSMPTALERRGDFSETRTTGNAPITIFNPLNNQLPYAGNIIPQSQINPQGFAVLNLFPVPCGGAACTTSNGLDPNNRQSNYVNSFVNSTPLTDRILRVDAPLGKKTSFYVSALQDYYATMGAGSLLQSTGAGWGQFLSTYGVPNVNIAANLVHTFTPTLINEFTTGINRSFQIVDADDTSACSGSFASIAPGASLPYTCSLRSNQNIKGPNGQVVSFPDLFPGANDQNLLPNIDFGAPTASGFTRQTAPTQDVSSAPGFGVNSRWPFRGTDQITSVTDSVTWIKGTHTLKFGFYLEHNSRNVTIYNNFNIGGTAWFGSDRANPNDTNWAYSNALIGSMFAYGVDNKRQLNHSRYTTYEAFIQDTWKVNRRLTIDAGLRIQSIGQVTNAGADLGFFNTPDFNKSTVGQLLYPSCTVAVPSGGCPKPNLVAVNPKTGKQYPFAQVGTFDPASYASNGGFPWSGAKFYKSAFWGRRVDFGPRIGFAYDVLGNGKMAIRGGFGIFYGRATSTDNIGASGNGTGPTEVAPYFLSPSYAYPTFGTLSGATASYAPQTIYGGNQDILNPQTIQWSFGVQRDIGKGTILDVSYLGWVTHHGFALSGWDLNAVPAFTTWKPTPGAGTNSCGQVTAFLDPTAAAVNPATCTGGAFLNSQIIRSITGYQGWNNINLGTNSGESNYNALQVQFNKRFGKRLQFGANYTWSKALTYSPGTQNTNGGGNNQMIAANLTRNFASGNRPHVVNINFGYKLQNGTSLLPSGARNYVTKLFLDGWNINGVMSFYSGQPQSIICAVSGAPIGYWTGTPTSSPNLRCNMSGSPLLADGATPVSANPGTIIDPKLWYPIAACANAISCGVTPNFTLPGKDSFGLGNAPLTQWWGPGFENADISVSKTFTLGKESRTMEFRAETFNILNHFNPGNLSDGNRTVTYQYADNKQTNANLGAISSANGNSRRMALSLKLRF